MKEKKKMPKSDVYLIISSIVFLIILFGWMFKSHSIKKNKIDQNYSVTMGIIIRNYTSANGDWNVEVKYKVNKICYSRDFSSTGWCSGNSCIGDSIKIEYSSKDPNVARAVRYNGKILYPSMKLRGKDYIINCNEGEKK